MGEKTEETLVGLRGPCYLCDVVEPKMVRFHDGPLAHGVRDDERTLSFDKFFDHSALAHVPTPLDALQRLTELEEGSS